MSAQTIGIGHPLRVRATLRNFSDESFEGNLLVRLLGDQNESALDEAMVSVGPQASTQVSFTHRLRKQARRCFTLNYPNRMIYLKTTEEA